MAWGGQHRPAQPQSAAKRRVRDRQGTKADACHVVVGRGESRKDTHTHTHTHTHAHKELDHTPKNLTMRYFLAIFFSVSTRSLSFRMSSSACSSRSLVSRRSAASVGCGERGRAGGERRRVAAAAHVREATRTRGGKEEEEGERERSIGSGEKRYCDGAARRLSITVLRREKERERERERKRRERERRCIILGPFLPVHSIQEQRHTPARQQPCNKRRQRRQDKRARARRAGPRRRGAAAMRSVARL